MTTREIIDAESGKLSGLDPEVLSPDARAIVTALSAVAGMLAAVALELGEASDES